MDKAQVILKDADGLEVNDSFASYDGACPICGKSLRVSSVVSARHSCGHEFDLREIGGDWALLF